MTVLRLGMSQINPTVGDFTGNRHRIMRDVARAREAGCDIVTFPEMVVTGYPPEDLLFKPQFVRESQRQLQEIVKETRAILAVVGFVDKDKHGLYNAAAVIGDGQLLAVYHKIILPNYGVFDEQRYFKPGNECVLLQVGGIDIGLNICEDIWFEDGPAALAAQNGASLIINISSSPYHAGKLRERQDMLAKLALKFGVTVCYNNQVGGQDELVFDGGSMVIGSDGQLLTRGPQFEEALVVTDVERDALKLGSADATFGAGRTEASGRWPVVRRAISANFTKTAKTVLPRYPTQDIAISEEVYRALVLGTHDYVIKNGFSQVVIGLSGGMDSSLVACIAVDALGAARVKGVAMPSRFSSSASYEDARALCENLGIELVTIPIEDVYSAYLSTLDGVFSEVPLDITEENIQARIRGNLLMALSNKFGLLVLTTGNKSEMATGYTTLYGDMAGGFAVIKDVPKTLVYKLGLYRNRRDAAPVIPANVLAKPPSAELHHGQKDSDTLPPYEVLDPILEAYVEQDKEVAEIISAGFDPEMVRRTARLVDLSEYKRRQSPPGVKITARAFGRDRRLPITNRFKGV